MSSSNFLKSVAAGFAITLLATCASTFAAESVKPSKSSTPAAKASAKKPAVAALAHATPEQIEAARLVYYGRYECEFKQFVEIVEDPRNMAYVDVKLGKNFYVMKPVLSSTGALRLEDVKGETLMVQIANKSMLLNVKAGRRLVDDCVSPRQRELIEAAATAKSDEAAAQAAAASAASAPAADASASAAASK